MEINNAKGICKMNKVNGKLITKLDNIKMVKNSQKFPFGLKLAQKVQYGSI